MTDILDEIEAEARRCAGLCCELTFHDPSTVLKLTAVARAAEALCPPLVRGVSHASPEWQRLYAALTALREAVGDL